MKKVTLMIIYLKSGNTVNITDDIDSINPVKTLEFFEQVASRFRDNATVNTKGSVGYFRYGGISVTFNNIEAIQISDDLYRESHVLAVSKDNKNINDKYSAMAFVGSELPKTQGDFTNGFFYIEN